MRVISHKLVSSESHNEVYFNQVNHSQGIIYNYL